MTTQQHPLADIAPKLVEPTNEVLFDDVWARPEPSPITQLKAIADKTEGE